MNTKKIVRDRIKFQDFCKIKTSKLVAAGLEKDSLVFVIGDQYVHEDKNDIYNARVKLVVSPLKDSHVEVDKGIMVDPSNLVKVGKAQAKRLKEVMEKDFSEFEE